MGSICLHDTQPPLFLDLRFDKRYIISRIEDAVGKTCTAFEPYLPGEDKTFTATFACGFRMLVRIQYPDPPCSICGRNRGNKLNSEYATMLFLQKMTKIPICEILKYGSDKGVDWMAHEMLPGVRLDSIWPRMSKQQRRLVCKSITGVWNELYSCSLGRIGSLRHGPNNPHYVGPMNFLLDHHMHTVDPLHTASRPFTSAEDWLVALASRNLSSFSSVKKQEQISSVIANIRNASSGDPKDFHIATFCIEHVDLRPRNILVDATDPTKITAIVGWKDAKVVPRFALKFNDILQGVESEEKEALCTMMLMNILRRLSHPASQLGLLHDIIMEDDFPRLQ